jgi:hypothetical protein
VPTMEAIRKDGESRHPHGSLSRPPVAIRSSGTGATANLPVVLLGGESHLGPATIRRRGSGPCACTACRSQRGTDLSNWVVLTIVSQWQKSDERRRPRGRTQQRETGAACRSETRRGATLDAGVIARPMEGALDHQYLRRPSRVVVGGWSWPRARRRLLTPVSGGLLSRGESPVRASVQSGGQAERGDGSVRGCQLGPRRGKRTPASKSTTDTSEVRGAS